MPTALSFGAALTVEAAAPARLDDLLGAAKELGLGHLRFAVPWAEAEPKSGSIDGSVFETLRAAADECRQRSIAPWFVLAQPEVPRWFDDDGGWLDGRTAGKFWPRWVETAAGALGDVAAGWVPFEAPYAIARRLAPQDPQRNGEVLATLVVAWRDAWRILRGGPPVATSLDVRMVRAADDSPEAADRARREDEARWSLWLRALNDGTMAVPGRAEREVADLQGACDVVGVAISADVETVLHRVGEMTPLRPLAVTFRPSGATDAARRGSVERMHRELDRTAGELDVRWVSVVTTDLAADVPLLLP
jgi:hypothetical protein